MIGSDPAEPEPPRTGGLHHGEPAVRSGLARGRALLNQGDFWGSHEALEPAWIAADPSEKRFVQGLIQAAAAFHKYIVQDMPDGAQTLLGWALEKLDGFPAAHRGLDVGAFRGELRRWSARIAEHPVAAGTLLGLPYLTWSDDGATDRLDIDSVELFEVTLPAGRAVLVAVTAQGRTGWGECRFAWDNHGLWANLVDALVPALLTEPVMAPSELPVRWSGLAANPCAGAGLEAAVWDLWASAAGWPLVEALGLVQASVPLAATAQGSLQHSLAAELPHLARAGYRLLVIPARPNADRRVLPELAAATRSAFAIHLGASYRMADLKALQAMDGLGARFFVQPFPGWDLADHKRLCRYLETPIALGGWTSEEHLHGAIALHALDVVALDPGLCGLTEAIRIGQFAASHRAPVWVSSSALTPIGALADLAVAAHPAMTFPADLSAASHPDGMPAFRPDAQGTASASSAPGLGWIPDAEWLHEVTTRHAMFKSG